MSENCVGCELMSGLCAARDALAPKVPEAKIVSEAADAMVRGSTDALEEAETAEQVAELEADFAASGTDEEPESRYGLVGEVLAAQSRRLDALEAHWAAVNDAWTADSKGLESTVRGLEINITWLGQVCTKGPKRSGACRAPRPDRNVARQALAWADREPGEQAPEA